MGVRESSPGKGKSTVYTTTLYKRVDDLEAEVGVGGSYVTGKADKSYVDQQDGLKADKTYVDGLTGDLSQLTTTDKTNLVHAVNANVSALADKANQSDLNATNSTVAVKADKTYVDSKFGSMGNTKTFKGSCTFASLPTSGMNVDDYWYVTDKTTNYCYNGTSWVDIGNSLNIGNGSIDGSKTNFMNLGDNILNPNTCTTGKYIYSTGLPVSNVNYSCTDFIPVNPGDVIYQQNMMDNYCATYDTNKNLVTYFSSTSRITYPYTVPAGVSYMRFSNYYLSISDIAANCMISKKPITKFETYGYFFTPSFLKDNSIPKTKEVNTKSLVLPSSCAAVTGQQFNVYFENILYNCTLDTVESVDVSNTTRRVYRDSARINIASGIGTTPIFKPYYDSMDENNPTTNLNLNIVDASVGSGLTKTCLFIGDSLTDNDIYTDELLNLFAKDVMGVQLLGTRTPTSGTTYYHNGLNKNEGRSGWGAKHYCTQSTYNGITNAFWNPSTSAFDFSYYMSQQGYTSVDYVFICLGTNDIGLDNTSLASGYIQYYNTMVNSIKAYNPNIKIGIWLLPMPCSLGGNSNGNNTWWQKTRFLTLSQALISTFDKRTAENIFLVPVYLSIDPINDFATYQEAVSSRNPLLVTRIDDNIHPAVYGYYKIADMMYAYIKYFASLG